jgi:competence protein ComEC
MPIDPGDLRIFVLNVGQADTSVVVTPEGKPVIIDAVKPSKTIRLLSDLGLEQDEEIEHLVITHPHGDHYRGVQALLNRYRVKSITLAPYWVDGLTFNSGYYTILGVIEDQGRPCRFVSGYEQVYLDDQPAQTSDGDLCMELIGPPNSLLEAMREARELRDENHLSVMARVSWRSFGMVFAADAQMENWGHFDREGMLEKDCTVLRAAHHGSKNGTQWERLERLDPAVVIVSSDPESTHDIPDLIGSATLLEYTRHSNSPIVALTHSTGTIAVEYRGSGDPDIGFFGEGKDSNVPLDSPTPLTLHSNPTNWRAILDQRLNA